MQIARDGYCYDEAVDPAGSGRVYTETTTPVEPEIEEEATTEDMENALKEVGVID